MLEYLWAAFLCKGADVIIHCLLPRLLTVHKIHAILRLMMRKRNARRTAPESAKCGRVNVKILGECLGLFPHPDMQGLKPELHL